MVFLTDWDLGTGVNEKKAKKRRTRGPKSLVEQGCFNHGGVGLHIVIPLVTVVMHLVSVFLLNFYFSA